MDDFNNYIRSKICLNKMVMQFLNTYISLDDAKDFLDDISYRERCKLIDLFKNNYDGKYIELKNIDLIKGDGAHYSIEGQKQVFEEVKKIFD